MRKISSLLLTTALFVLVTALPASADDWHGRDHLDDHFGHHEERRDDDFHWHGDIHHFREYDMIYWHGGHWFNGFHEGRNGWWWVVGGGWYFYPAPVYPYPDPYAPPGVTIVQGSTSSYYYCASPAGYYPYVASCAVAWQAVATTAAPPTVIQQPAPVPPVASQRDVDYQQLNAFSVELSHIDVNNPLHALAQLKSLKKRVTNFRKAIAHRRYNPIEIIKNIDDLRARIAAQRAAYAPPAAVAPVPTGSLPPGSTVIFPGQ